jgi:TonB family protein
VKATSLFGVLGVLACLELTGMPAHAQSGTLTPTGDTTEGRLSWICLKDEGKLLLDFSGYQHDGTVTSATWQFDQDEPETVYLRRRSGGPWLWGDRDAARFLSRVKSAKSLVIRMLGNRSWRPATAYTYDLERLSALRGVECVRDSAVPAAADRPPPEGLSHEAPSDSGGDVTYELSAVEQQPEMDNVAEIWRHVVRNYPPALRDAGIPGEVLVRFRVPKDGLVDIRSIEIIDSTNELFNAEVIRMLLRAHFRPAHINGRPVNVWVELPVRWFPPPPTSSPRN